MGSLLFAFGSALGAALAWLTGRREPSRSTIVALSGIASGLLGALTAASWRNTVPGIEIGLGLLGTAAPLTFCIAPAAVSRARVTSVVRHFTATLAVALVCGITCATAGFVSVVSIRQLSRKEHPQQSVESAAQRWLQPPPNSPVFADRS
ncbi:hypothetical protein A5679_13375 [Mycobacterium scrofulaceum]|uniref:Uncharacterized protein n=2 Tax=Mycobacterium scrofulaceum TaxID=1783 RepID=A0A1A2VW62_MYCSC|nr:hypothetical protein A5679_13375 [Mycobacterium scrofulaceum]